MRAPAEPKPQVIPDRPREREPEPYVPEPSLRLPPPIVLAPAGSVTPPAGGGWERAEAAVLAQRVLTHIRVGDRNEVRLGLSGIFAGAEVRLVLEAGRVVPTLVGDDPRQLEGLAQRLTQELAERGLDADLVRIEQS